MINPIRLIKVKKIKNELKKIKKDMCEHFDKMIALYVTNNEKGALIELNLYLEFGREFRRIVKENFDLFDAFDKVVVNEIIGLIDNMEKEGLKGISCLK